MEKEDTPPNLRHGAASSDSGFLSLATLSAHGAWSIDSPPFFSLGADPSAQREQSDGVALAQNRTNEDQPHSSKSAMASSIPTLAEGSFGKVYQEKYNGQDAAVKKILTNKLPRKDLQREFKIYEQANHPNIVKVLGPYTVKGNKYIIPLEFIFGEDLETTIFREEESKIQLTDAVRHIIILGMCEGLEYLHFKDIVHQDLKPDNIMVEHRTNRAVIIDLGLAKFYKDGLSSAEDRGNKAYAAPEVRRGKCQRSQSSDVWAMGKIIAELILMYRLKTDKVCPSTINQSLKDSSYLCVVPDMVQRKPVDRVTMAAVVQLLRSVPERTRPRHDTDRPPSNFLKIDVSNPETVGVGRGRFTRYEVRLQTNLPVFQLNESSVRRRYSEFEWLRSELERKSKVVVPPLPGKALLRQLPFHGDNGIFDDSFIDERREGLEQFLNKVASHPLVQNEQCLQMFLQEDFVPRNDTLCSLL